MKKYLDWFDKSGVYFAVLFFGFSILIIFGLIFSVPTFLIQILDLLFNLYLWLVFLSLIVQVYLSQPVFWLLKIVKWLFVIIFSLLFFGSTFVSFLFQLGLVNEITLKSLFK